MGSGVVMSKRGYRSGTTWCCLIVHAPFDTTSPGGVVSPTSSNARCQCDGLADVENKAARHFLRRVSSSGRVKNCWSGLGARVLTNRLHLKLVARGRALDVGQSRQPAFHLGDLGLQLGVGVLPEIHEVQILPCRVFPIAALLV